MNKGPGRGALVMGAALVGALLGWRLAQRQLVRHRAYLFSRRPLHRWAALGYLAGQATPDTIPLLRDYVVWEPVPALQRRARQLIRQLDLASE